jgi:hypothetical protein
MGTRACILVLGLGVAALACGDKDDDRGGSSGGPGMGSSGGGGTGDGSGGDDDGDGEDVFDVGAGGTGGDGGGGDQGDCPCENVMDGIYVLNSNTPPSVWFYSPPSNTFTEIGVLGCPAPAGATANSMAIDRRGNAYINYYELLAEVGHLYKAPLSDLQQCEELNYTNPPNEWWLLGMGYATRGAETTCDDLYLYKSDRYPEYPDFGPGGSELGRWDPDAEELVVIGPTDYPVGELTGTGDARLFTFAAMSQEEAVLVWLDKSTGEEKENTPLDIDITNAFAFAFWGGDVYFFTLSGPLGGNSIVTMYDYDMNEGGGLSVVNNDAGIRIPGAGVSTCASFTPPG